MIYEYKCGACFQLASLLASGPRPITAVYHTELNWLIINKEVVCLKDRARFINYLAKYKSDALGTWFN